MVAGAPVRRTQPPDRWTLCEPAPAGGGRKPDTKRGLLTHPAGRIALYRDDPVAAAPSIFATATRKTFQQPAIKQQRTNRAAYHIKPHAENVLL